MTTITIKHYANTTLVVDNVTAITLSLSVRAPLLREGRPTATRELSIFTRDVTPEEWQLFICCGKVTLDTHDDELPTLLEVRGGMVFLKFGVAQGLAYEGGLEAWYAAARDAAELTVQAWGQRRACLQRWLERELDPELEKNMTEVDAAGAVLYAIKSYERVDNIRACIARLEGAIAEARAMQ